VFIRTAGRTGAAMPAVVRGLRAAVHDVDDQQPVSSVETLEQVRGAQLAEPRLTTTLLASFAALALLLTATGLGGVIGYGVTQRLPEIAIRMALGATKRKVTALVVRDGLTIVIVGLVVGLGASMAGSRLIGKLLFHVTATDAVTYLMVAIVILGTATAACLAPARRAMGTDPARVMRGG
ncbi:MAG TPA: FtsX-like permease family protein, partial [Gemmatimonadaceae bacterium]